MLPPAAEDQVGVGVHQTGRHQAPACIDVPGPLEQVRRDLAVAQGRDDPLLRRQVRPGALGNPPLVRARRSGAAQGGGPEGRCWK